MKISSFFILLFILIVIVFLGGRCECPLMPMDEDDYTLETSETIGSEGGELTTDDFSLTVPAGAFDADVGLKLYVSEDDQPFGDNGISRTFKIEGLPDVYDGVLHLRIKYQGTISEQGYIAIGEEAFAPSLGEITTDYRLTQAVDSAGYLFCDLESPEEDIRRSPRMYKISRIGFLERYFTAVDGSTPKTKPEGHFKVFDASWEFESAQAESLLAYFENAYDALQSMGFSYNDRKEWPVEVIVRSFRLASGFVIPIGGKFTRNRRGYDYGHLTINAWIATDKELMRTIPGHEFFHLVQWLYDSRPESISYKEPWPHYWLDEATAVWSEEKYTEQELDTYVPNNLKSRETEPFKGMQKDWDKNNKLLALNHGYGMPGLVRYLLRTYGGDKLVKIYEEIRNNRAHPVDAIISNTESPVAWLEPFFREYVLGNIYNIEPSKWWAEHEGEFTIGSQDDKLKIFSHTYQDLSAKLFRILLEYSSLNSDVKITFTVDGGDNSEVTVFKYSDALGEVRSIGNSTSEVSVSEVKNLMDTGWDLLALVTNTRHESPYTGSSSIELKVELVEPPPIGRAAVDFRCLLTSLIDYKDEREDEEETKDMQLLMDEVKMDGYWNEDRTVFTYISEGGASLVIQRTLDPHVITSFYYTSSGTGEYATVNISISAEDIPSANVPFWEDRYYRAVGSAVCDVITDIVYTREYSDRTETVIEWKCNASSVFDIEIY